MYISDFPQTKRNKTEGEKKEQFHNQWKIRLFSNLFDLHDTER